MSGEARASAPGRLVTRTQPDWIGRARIQPERARPKAPAEKAIKQKRSRKTYNALLASALELLHGRPFHSITVAELALNAGYSVGAFYARFRSKEELFDALLAHQLRHRVDMAVRAIRTLSDDDLVEGFIHSLVLHHWDKRWLWRAALIRGADEQTSLHNRAEELAAALIGRMEAQSAIPAAVARDIRLAIRVVLGAVDSMIVYATMHPLGRKRLVDDLVRAFRLMCTCERPYPDGPKHRPPRGTSCSRKPARNM